MFVGSHFGKIIRFNESDVRNMGRVSRGVRAMMLEDEDYIIGMCIGNENGKLLTVSEKGYGKCTSLDEYKCQNRGGKGMMTYRISDETGNVAGMKIVEADDDIMLITSEGIIIRMESNEISTYGRVTKGVRLMRLADDVKILTVESVKKEEEADEEDAAEISEENAPETESAEE